MYACTLYVLYTFFRFCAMFSRELELGDKTLTVDQHLEGIGWRPRPLHIYFYVLEYTFRELKCPNFY